MPAMARKEQREIVSWSHHSGLLPRAISDMSSTYTLAPNDEGDIGMAIYLLGGCVADYVTKKDSSAEYFCPEVSDATLAFDPKGNLFEERHRMPRSRYRHGVVAVEGKIWVFGGRDENDRVINEVDVYDPSWDRWITVGSLSPDLARSDHALWAREGNVYLAGGYDSNYIALFTSVLIDVDATLAAYGDFNGDGLMAKLVSHRLSDMKEARGDVHSLSYGKYGYLIGGFSHIDGYCHPLKSVEVYDTQKDKWLHTNGLNVGRADAALMKYKGKFYAFGGETRVDEINGVNCSGNVEANQKLPRRKTHPINSVEVYDPISEDPRWQIIQGTSLPDDRLRFVLAPWPETDAIYGFGGVTYSPSDGKSKQTIDGCSNCLRVSDVIIEYVDGVEEYYISDTPFRLVAAGVTSILVTGALARAVWSSMRRRLDLKNRRQDNHDDGVHLNERAPYRDAEIL